MEIYESLNLNISFPLGNKNRSVVPQAHPILDWFAVSINSWFWAHFRANPFPCDSNYILPQSTALRVLNLQYALCENGVINWSWFCTFKTEPVQCKSPLRGINPMKSSRTVHERTFHLFGGNTYLAELVFIRKRCHLSINLLWFLLLIHYNLLFRHWK